MRLNLLFEFSYYWLYSGIMLGHLTYTSLIPLYMNNPPVILKMTTKFNIITVKIML